LRMLAEVRAEQKSGWAAMTRVLQLLGVGTRRRSASECAGSRSTKAAGPEPPVRSRRRRLRR
jgi:hypothetical protein